MLSWHLMIHDYACRNLIFYVGCSHLKYQRVAPIQIQFYFTKFYKLHPTSIWIRPIQYSLQYTHALLFSPRSIYEIQGVNYMHNRAVGRIENLGEGANSSMVGIIINQSPFWNKALQEESLISVLNSGFKPLRMHTQGCQGCQKIRNLVRNSKILIARSTIQPKLSKIKKH